MKIISLAKFFALTLMTVGTVASAAPPVIVPFHFTHGGFVAKVTPDGSWAVGGPRGGDAYETTQIVNLKTGELIDLPVDKIITKSGDEKKPDATVSYHTCAISEDGSIIGGGIGGNPAFYKDGVWTLLAYDYVDYQAEVVSIRQNGKYMVGMAYNDSFRMRPLLWEDGKLVDLEGLPDRDVNGNMLGTGTCTMRFYDISEDGRYILGGMSTNVSNDGCCYFVYDSEKKSYNYLGAKLLSEKIESGELYPESEVEGSAAPILSQNGKYVAGTVFLLYNDGTFFGRDTHVPFLYNVETEDFTLYEGAQNEDLIILGVTNDGHIVASTPYLNTALQRNVVFLSDDGQWYTLENILKQEYGIDFCEASGLTMSGTVSGISADGKVLTAMGPGVVNDGYSVFLDDCTFFDATKNVNLLSDYEVIPADNSKIALLENVYVRFDNLYQPVSKDAVEIRTSDGSVVAKSKDIALYNDEDRLYEITFDLVDLEGGVKYDVVIPEGTFTVPSVGHNNKEIVVSYIGRDTKPVVAESVFPADNSAVNELSIYNMITLGFDTEVAVVTGKTGYLYQDDKESPLCELMLVASDNQVSAYPAVGLKLMKDSEYKVVIPEGSIVDNLGYCPNDEITLDYKGAYEIPAPDIYSDYLFFEDFNDMAASLAHMLRYEGDHNEPIADMKYMEFDADNQPWNFSIRESADSYDFVAASHSMYTNQGQSDDWMSTSQITLSNGKEHFSLNFQAQSYYKNKEDRLKVIVWECEEVFNSLNSDIVDRMRDEGKVVFHEKLSPGAKEEVFEDDWVDYKVDLDPYKGKSIYIAFVNENQNQSMIFVDNIKVEKMANYRLGFLMPSNVTSVEKITVEAYVEVTSDETFNNLKAVLRDGADKEVSTFTATGIDLSKESGVYKFTFDKELELEKGEDNPYSMVVTLDEDEQAVNSSILQLLFETTKRVVVEEMTGDWCGNCPLGILCMEELEKTIGDKVIPVSIHNRDEYDWADYYNFLGLSAAPSGRVNRMEKITYPVVKLDNGSYSFTTVTGDETFKDYVVSELQSPAVADIKITEAEFYDGSANIGVKAEVNFAINASDVNYNILTLLVEDGLPGRQSNYFAGQTDPLLGEWATGGSYKNVKYLDVARSISGNSFYGEYGYIPSVVKAGEIYSADITLPISAVESLDNCKVICMLIDVSTGYICNAYRLNNIGFDDTGVDEISDVAAGKVTVEDGVIYVDGNSSDVDVYTMQGIKVANHSLAAGIYVVKASVDGKVIATKIAVK